MEIIGFIILGVIIFVVVGILGWGLKGLGAQGNRWDIQFPVRGMEFMLVSHRLDNTDYYFPVGISLINMADMGQKSRKEREAEFRAKIAKLDAYVKEMNAKGNLSDEETKELWSAMRKTNKYLRAIGAPESEMYDL